MRKTKETIFVLGAILFFFGMMVGCEKREKKYIGKYIYKGSNNLVKTLEINSDGTYKLIETSPYIPHLGKPWVFTGTWEIVREGREEAIVFYPLTLATPKPLVKKGNDLFSRLTDETFVKQD